MKVRVEVKFKNTITYNKRIIKNKRWSSENPIA